MSMTDMGKLREQAGFISSPLLLLAVAILVGAVVFFGRFPFIQQRTHETWITFDEYAPTELRATPWGAVKDIVIFNPSPYVERLLAHKNVGRFLLVNSKAVHADSKAWSQEHHLSFWAILKRELRWQSNITIKQRIVDVSSRVSRWCAPGVFPCELHQLGWHGTASGNWNTEVIYWNDPVAFYGNIGPQLSFGSFSSIAYQRPSGSPQHTRIDRERGGANKKQECEYDQQGVVIGSNPTPQPTHDEAERKGTIVIVGILGGLSFMALAFYFFIYRITKTIDKH